MGYTLAEKILMKNTGETNIKPGDIVIAKPDCYMVHDIYTSFLKRALQEMHVKRFVYPERLVIVFDHLMPTNQAATDSIHFKDGLEIAEKYGVKNVLKGKGISHSLMHELRYAKPARLRLPQIVIQLHMVVLDVFVQVLDIQKWRLR